MNQVRVQHSPNYDSSLQIAHRTQKIVTYGPSHHEDDDGVDDDDDEHDDYSYYFFYYWSERAKTGLYLLTFNLLFVKFFIICVQCPVRAGWQNGLLSCMWRKWQQSKCVVFETQPALRQAPFVRSAI